MKEPQKFIINGAIQELKQNVNLSETAWNIFVDDVRTFNTTESGLFNTIFINYHYDSLANISVRLETKRKELEDFYSGQDFLSVNKDLIGKIIDKQLEKYEEELVDYVCSFQKGISKKIRLNNNTLSLLRDCSCAGYFKREFVTSYETTYGDKRVGPFLKAVFEDYANKPFFEREQIYFKEIIDKIKQAIDGEIQVRITIKEKMNKKGEKIPYKFVVAPYKIVQDKNKLYNYIIGFGKPFGSSEEERKPACYRISRIDDVFVQTSSSYHISKKESSMLDNDMFKRGAMFLTDEIIEVKVEFTKRGLENFNRFLYQRPNEYEIDEINPFLYSFKTTKNQAINYFFKFGWDAKIVEPDYLFLEFKKRYERAAQVYNGMTKSDIALKEKQELEDGNK